MLGKETLKSTVGPSAIVRLLFILVTALSNFCADFGLILILAKLFYQVFNVESIGSIEQFHLVEDTLNVAPGRLVVLEVPFLELLHIVVGNI